MAHSYLAFIDESGDDGLDKFRVPGGRGGASQWLVISALVFRQVYSLEAVSWRNEILAKMPDRRARTLHFAHLNHGQRLAAASVLGEKPVRVINVMADKRVIPEGTYTEKNQLYFYMARYLIERLSWLCRDLRRQTPEGDGRVAITFSRRGGMSYESFREYLTVLKAMEGADVRIHWPVIDIDAVDAQDHSRSASLQLADIATTSFACGLELDQYGNCETRYSEHLRRVTYKHSGKYLSYGVKIVPKVEDCLINPEQARFLQLYE